MAREATIRVRFDKNGFYHPTYGRLGRGRNEGTIYILPDAFAERETVQVPVMDQSSKPPRQISEKEVTRYKYLPSTEEMQEAARFDEEAEMPVVKKPKESDGTLEYLPGKGKTSKAQGAQERTTGRARRKKPAAAEAE